MIVMKDESEKDNIEQMIYKDLEQLIRERFLDDKKSLASKIMIKNALSKILGDLDHEIQLEQGLDVKQKSEDSTHEDSNLSP
jgi:hypothetical protein